MTAAPRADAVEAPRAETRSDTFVVFAVDGVRYALPVAAVQRTLPYPLVTRLPAVARHVLGVFQHGGRVITLWDLHALVAAAAEAPAAPWVVVSEHDGRLLGLAVDHVENVVSVGAWALADPEEVHPQALGFVRGVVVPVETDAQEGHDAAAQSGIEPAPAPAFASTGLTDARPIDRGVEELRTLHPVHLVDLAALRRLGAGEGLA